MEESDLQPYSASPLLRVRLSCHTNPRGPTWRNPLLQQHKLVTRHSDRIGGICFTAALRVSVAPREIILPHKTTWTTVEESVIDSPSHPAVDFSYQLFQSLTWSSSVFSTSKCTEPSDKFSYLVGHRACGSRSIICARTR